MLCCHIGGCLVETWAAIGRSLFVCSFVCLLLLFVCSLRFVVLSHGWLSGCIWLKPVKPLARACLLVHLFLSCCCLFVSCDLLCCHIGGCLVAFGWNQCSHWPELVCLFICLSLVVCCVWLCCHIVGCLVALGWNKWSHWPQLIAGFPLLILLLNFNIHTLSPLFNPSQTVKCSHRVQLTRKVWRSSGFPSVRPSRGGMRLRQRRLELLWRRGRMSWHRTPGD